MPGMEAVEGTANQADLVYLPTSCGCVPRGVTAAFTAKLWRLTHPGTFVGLWGSPMIHSIRSSGDLTQSGHLLCSSNHSVADSHTGLRQVAARAWYLGSYYSSGLGLRHHGVAVRACYGHGGRSRTPRSGKKWSSNQKSSQESRFHCENRISSG